MTTQPDSAFPTGDSPHGEVSVRPFRTDGKPFGDPFQIFKDADHAKNTLSLRGAEVNKIQKNGTIPLLDNLVVNLGRQTLAYIVGGKDFNPASPTQPWAVTKASFGSYDETPRFTDSTLSPQPSLVFTGGENEIILDTGSGATKKRITSVDWPQSFLVRFEIVLTEAEANGFLIRELGLWTENETLFARKAIPAINKQQEFGLSFLWRIRF